MGESNVPDPFATSAMWSAAWTAENAEDDSPLTLFTGVEFDIPHLKIENPYAPSKDLSEELCLPKLESLDIAGLDEPTASDGSVFSAEPAPLSPVGSENLGLWDPPFDASLTDEGKRLFTWESFVDADHREPEAPYLSEAGATGFDAALQLYAAQPSSVYSNGNAIQAGPLTRSMLSLGLGRSSVCFTYDETAQRFQQAVENTRIPGHSLDSSSDLISIVSSCGNLLRELRTFVDKAYRSSATLPAMVALAASVDTILTVYSSCVEARSAEVRSVVQLAHEFSRPAQILQRLQEAVKLVKAASSDAELLSLFFDYLKNFDGTSDGLLQMFRVILSRVAKPWLQQANSWIGLWPRAEAGSTSTLSNPLLDMTDGPEPHGRLPFDVPSFVDQTVTHEMLHVGTSLRILQQHEESHPLLTKDHSTAAIPELELGFGWDDIGRIKEEAEHYERSLSSAVLRYSSSEKHTDSANLRNDQANTAPFSDTHSSLDAIWDHFAQDIERPFASAALPVYVDLRSLLAETTVAVLDPGHIPHSTTFDPEISLASSLSFSPPLFAQGRLVNAAVMRLLFRSHDLRAHLELQRHFHLLGNGTFVTQLTSALFDPARATAERRKGVVRTGETMGLRLGTRSTWPPASSELQLALMGILSDCYEHSSLPKSFSKPTAKLVMAREHAELPGSLSFSVRQLSPEDADKCMDPNSLYALDFLRLQYNGASPVDAVITPASLEKYDAIFKILLRLLRMLFVTSHIPSHGTSPETSRFRFEARHFVATCASYFFDTGVSETWSSFSAYLDGLTRRMRKEDERDGLGKHVTEGLEDLRRTHELYLDRIRFNLLLREKQVKVMSLLEEAFGVILSFAKACHEAAVGQDGMLQLDRDAVTAMRASFRAKATEFVSACSGLTGRKGRRAGVVGNEDNTIDRLLLGLEIYWI